MVHAFLLSQCHNFLPVIEAPTKSGLPHHTPPRKRRLPKSSPTSLHILICPMLTRHITRNRNATTRCPTFSLPDGSFFPSIAQPKDDHLFGDSILSATRNPFLQETMNTIFGQHPVDTSNVFSIHSYRRPSRRIQGGMGFLHGTRNLPAPADLSTLRFDFTAPVSPTLRFQKSTTRTCLS